MGKPTESDVSIVLCVKLDDNVDLDKSLINKIKATIRNSATPRHVPHFIFKVDEIPYTISGKKVEKAVLHSMLGKKVKNKDALSNPDSLFQYENLPF